MVKKKDFFFDQVDRKIVVEINFRKHLFLFLAIEMIYATLLYDLLYYFTYFSSTMLLLDNTIEHGFGQNSGRKSQEVFKTCAGSLQYANNL